MLHSTELLSCPELHSILRLVLKAGNYMNAVSGRRGALNTGSCSNARRSYGRPLYPRTMVAAAGHVFSGAPV